MKSGLPIDAALPELLAALAGERQAVLQAPPGAGKTTVVPLAMLEAGLTDQRILMLEPRRLATRAAAERMSQTLGEPLGQTVGFRIKGESKSSAKTRIEVVTEGILTRMIQSDPELSGIGAVIFDEFHERSLQADLGLALCLEIREALRPDLMLLVMSATLDAGPVAALMGDAPMITSEGQSFPVETHWLAKPWAKPNTRGPRFEDALADLVAQAVEENDGGVLVFAPGAGEIQRLETRLKPRLPKDVSLHPLYGALDFKAQRAAIAPATKGRKVVLATSIAETSLTIQDVRVVVDGGRARRARFDPGSGMSRLVTERVTKAEAIQRRGRAGRVAPGVCYRMWTKGEEGGMAPFPPAEIEAADLAGLVLELAQWGETDPTNLSFLSQPSAAAISEARALLTSLEALTPTGQITPHGKQMAALPLHPRLAHMVLRGGRDAPLMAALLSERDPLAGGGARPPSDLSLRMEALRDVKRFESDRPYRANRGVIERIRAEAKRLKSQSKTNYGFGELAALAYPDRIGLRRKGDAARYVLSGGKGAIIDDGDPMGHNRLVVATDLDGDQREARVRQAVAISETDVRALFADQIEQRQTCVWSKRDRAVQARMQEVLGALVLSDANWPDCPQEAVADAMLDGVRELGFASLTFSKPAELLLGRIEWLRARGSDLPDCSPDGLITALEDWLLPHIGKARKAADLKSVDTLSALKAYLSWDQSQLLEKLAPVAITAPTGTRLPIDYSGEQPAVSVRVQEMFGLNSHPTVGPDRLPLLINLLSPAQRPVQSTADLPNFWQTSYQDVRKDMRGRYPRHPWPEDPTQADPTRRVKGR